MTLFHYPPGGGWRLIEVAQPTWDRVEQAIRGLDDCEHPIVQLSRCDVATCMDDEASLNIVGGADVGYALFATMGAWLFEDPSGSSEPVRLWQSDQGYWCERRNLLVSVEDVLHLVWAYCDGRSFSEMTQIAGQLTP
ncbi:hypothetical protein VQ02_33200 [Methylobacterium variabile]|jgi:hypothetical protein|uniref:Uncharacterized protein n=1 Tax=Methylobacterium variabile TaxID=298794 RepID=A0A0J6RXA1_9HYPH|nr:hypothetical protein [Methylobacterium variabile]KMO27480.1 hypothetical protein VQ02_33200 [Methylobacterium variabile]